MTVSRASLRNRGWKRGDFSWAKTLSFMDDYDNKSTMYSHFENVLWHPSKSSMSVLTMEVKKLKSSLS